MKTYLENNYLGGSTDVDVERMRDEILYGALNGSDVETGTLWFSKMTKFLNVLKVGTVACFCFVLVIFYGLFDFISFL